MGAAPAHTVNPGLFEGYETGSFYDEMFDSPGNPRAQYRKLYQRYTELGRSLAPLLRTL